MDETDLFFNLRLGEIVLHDHAVPRTNLLSFTYPDARDVNLAWLFQIVLALAYRAGGIPGTVLLKTAFVLATIAVLFRVALRRGAHPAAAAAALALAAWAAEPRFVERPHLVTFLGLALTLLALERAEAGRPRALYALVPLRPRLGQRELLLLPGAGSCSRSTRSARALDGRARRRAPRGAVRRSRSCPLIFATPSGVHALGYIANHWRMPWLRPLQEYEPARWPDDAPGRLRRGRRRAGRGASPGPPLAPAAAGRCCSASLGARRNRFVAEFALLAGPIVAVRAHRRRRRAWPRAWPSAPAGRSAASPPSPPSRCSPAPRWCRASPPRATAAVRRPRPRSRRWSRRPRSRFANDNGLRERMYNDLEVGSYLTWEGWPPAPRLPGSAHQRLPARVPRQLRRDDLSRAPNGTRCSTGFGVTTALVTYPDLNPRAALFDPDALGARLPRRRRPGVRRAAARVRRARRPRRDPDDVRVRPRRRA